VTRSSVRLLCKDEQPGNLGSSSGRRIKSEAEQTQAELILYIVMVTFRKD